ncbi:TIGR01777 family oxidoreductase [Brevibacterium daeguense]|uniref:TIGR01777 family oxidoreductase n=1 Tax=Brevibacterium daeguense TaxID=909936 RepID=A0ABP8EEZ6_9MICO
MIAGASGFIGERLSEDLAGRGYRVATIGRCGPVTWSDPRAIERLVDGAQLLVNLAGKNVSGRYNDRNRNAILHSRIDTTRALREAVAKAELPPRLWLNASTATIYRHAMDRPQTEDSGELGTGFSVDVARTWEQEFFAGELPGVRRVALRMAIVLGDGPATNKLLVITRLGLGGPQIDGWWPAHRRYRGIGPDPTGDLSPSHRTRGEQRFSWIHIDDVLAAIRFIEEHEDISGAVNLAAPNPVTNRELMAILRRAVRRPFGLPAYRWMLEPAMFVLRVEPEMLLKSRWVLPERLEQAGFEFRWPQLEGAIGNVVAER